jgi:hypothetical protein
MAAGKREFLERVVEDLNLDIRDPFTLLLANAMALADQRDALKAELSTHQSALEEAEGRCCPEDVGFEEWIGVLKKRDNVVAHTHLREMVSLLLQRRCRSGRCVTARITRSNCSAPSTSCTAASPSLPMY